MLMRLVSEDVVRAPPPLSCCAAADRGITPTRVLKEDNMTTVDIGIRFDTGVPTAWQQQSSLTELSGRPLDRCMRWHDG
jgi:hypothetical protein